MTEKGRLWQQEPWADSAAAFQMREAGHFREPSGSTGQGWPRSSPTLRPQAMLPNTVDLGDATVVLTPGRQEGAPTH
ncbi:hypothetical protein [Streptomyces sp. NPDC006463]|uniref:hypothetical protein n=1 Tax=Streptomyces sp. NPDC006463 TaxID=3364746 RepID=UPI0036868D14